MASDHPRPEIMAKVTGTADGTCYLLDTLPPELRNLVYKLVICQGNEMIYVNATGYTRPALLSTCHQVRNEALKMFYAEHKFHLASRNYDATVAFQFSLRTPSVLGKPPRVQRTNREKQQPNWTNLMRAMKWTHMGVHGIAFEKPVTFVKERYGSTTKDQIVVSGMFMTARELYRVPWTTVEKIFMGQRPVWEALDPRWAADTGTKS